MSLRIDDGRSRGRSKSPGRRDERSRLRDVRAPSPAAVIHVKDTRKSSKKYYSDDSDSDSRSRKKSSKKQYSDSDSDSDPKSKRKPLRKRYDSDDSDSDPRSKRTLSSRHHDESDLETKHRKNSSKKHYSDSDSDSKKKKKSSKKKYSESSSSSSSEEERNRKHKSSSHRGSSSPDTRSKPALVRTSNSEYVEVAKPKYERSEHGSYEAHRDRPIEYKRHLSNSSMEGGEKYRQLPMPGGFSGGHPPHPQYIYFGRYHGMI